MLGRCGSDLTLDSAKALTDQLFQGPSCTVSGQHGQIVDMDIRISVCLRDLVVIDLRQPVIGSNSSGVA